jgi:hypothetical protein
MELSKMFSAAHTQILLYQYFKNDSEDPLAFKNRQYPNQEQASKQLDRMIQGLNTLGFNPPVELVSRRDEHKEPRNYSYPQFTVCSPVTDGPHSLVSVALRESVQKYLDLNPGAFKFAGSDPWVSQTRLITVRPDQKADHLNFNQFLALMVELPFGDLANLRSFLEKHNYLVLKTEFLRERVWHWKKGDTESSMPTYVFVGRAEDEGSAVGEWVMDIPTPIYNLHTPTRKSCVERGYPYVNYIVHERAEDFIQYHYEYVDLGLAVFLHSYLDRDIKQRLQTQAVGLTKLMESLDGADEEKLSEDFKTFRKTATEVAKISGTVPEIEMMGRRLTEKYSSPNPWFPSIFQMIAGDNKEFLESSVGAVVQSTKVLQDLFLVLFEKRSEEHRKRILQFEKQSEEHRKRIEDFLKVISAFAVVMVLKEIWRSKDAPKVFTQMATFLQGWNGPPILAAHPGYFYSFSLVGAGLAAVLWLYLMFEERWNLHWSIVTFGPLAPALSMFVWLKWASPMWALLAGLTLAALISIRAGASSKKESPFRVRSVGFLLTAILPLYTCLVLFIGGCLLSIVQ